MGCLYGVDKGNVSRSLRRIEDLGGMLPAIEKGFFQSEISDAAYRYQREIDENVRRVVGVNAYNEEKDVKIPLLEMDPEGYEKQVARLKKLRETRNNEKVQKSLARLKNACEGTENTMPFILDSVREYATLGEIVNVMKDVFGGYEEPTWI